MILPLEEGGTTKYVGEDIFLMEYTFKDVVMNGFIFHGGDCMIMF